MTDPINLPLIDVAALAVNILDLTKALKNEVSFSQVELDVFREYTSCMDSKYHTPFAMAWAEMRVGARRVTAGYWNNEEYINGCMVVVPLIELADIKGFNALQLYQLRDVVSTKNKYGSFQVQVKLGNTVDDYLQKIDDEISKFHAQQVVKTPKETKVPGVEDLEKNIIFDSSDAFNATAIGLVQILVKAGVLHIADDGKTIEQPVVEILPEPDESTPGVDCVRNALACVGLQSPSAAHMSAPVYVRKYNTIEIKFGWTDYLLVADAVCSADDIIIIPQTHHYTSLKKNMFNVSELRAAASVCTETSNVYIVNSYQMTGVQIADIYTALGKSVKQKFIILG